MENGTPALHPILTIVSDAEGRTQLQSKMPLADVRRALQDALDAVNIQFMAAQLGLLKTEKPLIEVAGRIPE